MRREYRGRFTPPSQVRDPDMHHGTCVTHVPWCIPGSLTSTSFLLSRWRGKRSRHSRRMRNPQFCVSGKRPMEWYWTVRRHLYGSLLVTWYKNIFPQEIFFSARNIFFSARNIFFPQEINFSPQEIYFFPQKIFFSARNIFFRKKYIFLRKKYIFFRKKYFFPQEIFFSARNKFFSARNIFFSARNIFFRKKYFFPQEIFFSARNIFLRTKYESSFTFSEAFTSMQLPMLKIMFKIKPIKFYFNKDDVMMIPDTLCCN